MTLELKKARLDVGARRVSGLTRLNRSCTAPGGSAIAARPPSSRCARAPVSLWWVSPNCQGLAAVGGGLALLRSGDIVRIDLAEGTADMIVDPAELAARRTALEAAGGRRYPRSQTAWRHIRRDPAGQRHTGTILQASEQYQRFSRERGLPRGGH